jgi:hypothetical protein
MRLKWWQCLWLAICLLLAAEIWHECAVDFPKEGGLALTKSELLGSQAIVAATWFGIWIAMCYALYLGGSTVGWLVRRFHQPR